jgi:transitional endoplasmic reticulum ATPase
MDLIDPALLRAGRLETHLELGLPTAESRRAFFAISDVPLASDVDLEHVIAATGGMSFADLSGLLREAALQALRRDGTALAVTSADFDAALARLGGF